MRSYIKLIKLLPTKQLYKLLILIPLMGVSGILEVASVASLIPLMTVALEPDKVNHWASIVGLSGISYPNAMLSLVLLVILLFVAKGIFGIFVYGLSYNFVAYAKASYQKIMFTSYMQKEFMFHLENNTGDYLRNLTTECNAVEARFIMPSLVLFAEVIPLSFLIFFLLYLNPYGLALSGGLFIFFGYAIAKFNSKKLKELAKLQISADGSIVKIIQQVFSSIREVIIYDRVSKVEECFAVHSDISASSISKGLLYNAIPKFLLEIVAIFCVFLIAFVSYSSGKSIQDILIELGIFLATMIKVLPSASKIVSHIQALSYAKPSIANYLNVIDQKEENYTVPQTSFERLQTIELKDVAFGYDDGRNILEGVDFRIESGDIVGIVGETGSGKSTLLNLILGLIEPSEGDILVNGKPLPAVKSSYWERIGYVPQETYLIDDSIFKNVTFYRDADFEKVEKAIELASLKTTIDSLPEGLGTGAGEAGCNLSGGQRQRVGFARSLVADPDLLVLDEATSALDRMTESKIVQSLTNIKGEKTIIMIAHRESTLSVCDYILRVENGCVSIVNNRPCQ